MDMKRLIAITICLGMAVNTNAKVRDKADLCLSIAKGAESVMTDRQNGESMISLLESNENTYKSTKYKAGYTLMKAMILDAYKQPQYTTDTFKQRTIDDFVAKYYLMCNQEIK